MHICLHLDNDVISWESNNPSDFVTQSFEKKFEPQKRLIELAFKALQMGQRFKNMSSL